MQKSTRMLNIKALRTGDLIFSSTNGFFSRWIRVATRSQYSHVSIYLENGVILEANDDGVGPRKIEALATAPDGSLAGVPYDDWTSLTVLRSIDVQPAHWVSAIRTSLPDLLGLDFPPCPVLLQAVPPPLRVLLLPPAYLISATAWLFNRNPMQYSVWCSRLVGRVLLNHFRPQISTAERSILERPSPQQVYEFGMNHHYKVEDGAVCAPTLLDANQFDESRHKFLTEQTNTYSEWRELADKRRDTIRKEHSFRLSRLMVRLTAAVVLILLVTTFATPCSHPGCEPLGAPKAESALKVLHDNAPQDPDYLQDILALITKDKTASIPAVMIAASPGLQELERRLKLKGHAPGANNLYFLHGPGGSGKSPFVDHLHEAYRPAYVNLTKLRLEVEKGTSEWAVAATELKINGKDVAWQPRLLPNALRDGLEAFVTGVDGNSTQEDFSKGLLVDSLDEVHPESAVQLLEIIASYATAHPDCIIVIAARGEAFRDYLVRHELRSIREIRLPNVYLGDALLPWYVDNYCKYANKALTSTPEALLSGLQNLLKEHPFTRHFLYPGALGNFAVENGRYEKLSDQRLEALMFQSLIERNNHTHHRPIKRDAETWRLYADALIQVARKFEPNEAGIFTVGATDTVCVVNGADTVTVNVGDLLMRSGLVALNPVNVQYLEFSFWPQTLHAFLAKGVLE